MKGVDPDGNPVEYSRREAVRPVPRGPLTRSQVSDLQGTIALGLARLGYSQTQIGQVIGRTKQTAYRHSRAALATMRV